MLFSHLLRVFLLLCLAWCARSYSAAPLFEVVLEDTAPGEIKAIIQDNDGYMWFGGRNALLRYNAYKYQSIQAVEQKGAEVKNVSPYYVTNLLQDSAGTLWVTAHSGLYYFDKKREILLRPTTEDGRTDEFFLSALQDIKELPSGELIAGGDGAGLAIFDKKTFRISWRQTDSQVEPQSAPMILERTIQKILVDSRQNIWVANNKGLNLFDLATKQFSLFVPNPDNPSSKADNALVALAEDRAGRILGGTIGKGLYVFDVKTHVFRHYKNDPNNPDSLPDDSIWRILIDSEQTIWLSQARSGIVSFDVDTEKFTHYPYTYGQPGALAYGATRALYEDKDMNIWVGHYPGKVSFHDRNTQPISIYRKNPDNPEGMSDNNVQRVVEDKNGTIWMTVGDGVNALNRKTDKVKRYLKKLGNYPANGSLSAYVDSHNSVWVGTWTEGFFRFNAQADRFETMPFNAALAASADKRSDRLNDATVWAFCETRNNEFWIGTHYAGLSRFDLAAGQFIKYRNENTPTSLPNNIVWTCYEDQKGRFWVGTANGLSLMDQQTQTFKSYKPQENNPHSLRAASVEDIYEDAKGRLWFTTSSGLHLYREETDDFEVFTTINGFDNNGIRAVTGDGAGNLWLGTNTGIILFNPDTGLVKNYSSFGGKKIGGVNAGAAIVSAGGEIILGTTDGLIIIDAQQLRQNHRPPPVVLTDFKIFAQSVGINDKQAVLTQAINQTERLVLDYKKQMFSFEFAALNFRDASKNRYAYKLEGFDRDWREIGSAREAQYTNLSPGEYVFKVRASNNDGVWTQNPKQIAIIQLPPPWKTWWAYSIYTLLAILAVVYLVQQQKRKQRLVEEQNRLLEIKVAERTADLAAKNNDIQSMLSNMRQGLLTVEEGGWVMPEYSAFLETIFETQAIAGRDVFELLFAEAQLDQDTLGQIKSCLASMIGSDIINYELNAHLLINEYELLINNRLKIIALDWNPVIDSRHILIKLMISVRDITQLKALEREADVKKRELVMVGQLVAIGSQAFGRYYESSLNYLAHCTACIQQATVINHEVLSLLLRNMHTIKGNSRALGFSHLANLAHQAETHFAHTDAADVAAAKNYLCDALQPVAKALDEYQQVFSHVLHWDKSPEVNQGVWLSHVLLADLQAKINAVKPLSPVLFTPIEAALNRIGGAPLSQVLAPVLRGLPSLAAELGKANPQVRIEDGDIVLREACHNPVCDVFTHLVRNALDHGIEEEHTRLIKHKPAYGTLSISVRDGENVIELDMSDDGAGLNLTRLYQKALQQGLLASETAITREALANIIFTAGFSTKEQLNTISGRGVGMEAVRQLVAELGGDIQLHIPQGENLFVVATPAETIAFKVLIRLPKDKWACS